MKRSVRSQTQFLVRNVRLKLPIETCIAHMSECTIDLENLTYNWVRCNSNLATETCAFAKGTKGKPELTRVRAITRGNLLAILPSFGS